MNRFRNKKKAREEPENEASGGFWSRKGKKVVEEEEKAEVDLTAALPSTDDFRTSLLMTGLSARFSMLREQDDPNTKIGKASDDSVLTTTMGGTGAFNGLGDIAEVESIRSGVAVPRLDSYHSSDADSLNGSIMTRAKPTEGNNLFGGRQKIYKIPVGAPGKGGNGGMGGRALYDDDVALSAFQRWRKGERDRRSSDGEGGDLSQRNSLEEQDDQDRRSSTRSSREYDRKRETTSTTSSVPSAARNSTAATSVTSQMGRESSAFSAGGPNSTTGGPAAALDRTNTRTRRLYENSLNHDLREQQTSALSRVDTLTRQGTIRSRTSEAVPGSAASSTPAGFPERLTNERRILSRGSAPNLRSNSPSSIVSPSGSTTDASFRESAGSQQRVTSGGGPPLSPPISETDEMSNLAIDPNDRGKATALGVFKKPMQPYDESTYAQRQLQRQQARDSSPQRFRTDSNASMNTRSQPPSVASQARELSSGVTSSSCPGSEPTDKVNDRMSDISAEPKVGELAALGPFLVEDLVPSLPQDELAACTPTPPASLSIQRPADQDHPAFRELALPTPISIVSRCSPDQSPQSEVASALTPNTETTPADSPTLGGLGVMAGLSGMVRQHLRSDSAASSLYGAGFPAAESKPQHAADDEPKDASDLATKSNEQADGERGQWNEPQDATDEKDEFASQLADGARRIREKLSFYRETEQKQAAASPNTPSENSETFTSASPQQPNRSNTLGVLKLKSSRGSLVERSRDSNATRSLKLPSPSGILPPKKSMDEMRRPVATPEDIPKLPPTPQPEASPGVPEESAGLRAFRQARREMQRVKEMETQQRYHSSQFPQPAHGAAPGPPPSGPLPMAGQSGQRSRVVNRDPNSSQSFYQQRSTSQEYPGSPTGPHAMSRVDRDRSGSNSSGERSHSRPPPRPRPGPMSTGIPQPPVGPGRSMASPPPGYHSNSPQRMNTNLQVQPPYRNFDSNHPSPISPAVSPLPQSQSGPSSPAAMSPRRARAPSMTTGPDGIETPGVSEYTRRNVKKRDISEPTFVMSTSQVPTVALPNEPAGNRSRSNSRSRSGSKTEPPHSAPPVPPINPRRRQDGPRSRTVFGSLVGRRPDGFDESVNASTPNLGTTSTAFEEARNAFSVSDDEEAKPGRRQFRKTAGDAPATQRPFGTRIPQAPVYNIGPPASRMVVTQNKPQDRNYPGGMI